MSENGIVEKQKYNGPNRRLKKDDITCAFHGELEKRFLVGDKKFEKLESKINYIFIMQVIVLLLTGIFSLYKIPTLTG